MKNSRRQELSADLQADAASESDLLKDEVPDLSLTR
jgi:hypothetical protein